MNAPHLKNLKPELWYHGTDEPSKYSILRNGFRAGTYFARHMEDAVHFGGAQIAVVAVEFDLPESEWQACCANDISPSAIITWFRIGGYRTGYNSIEAALTAVKEKNV